MTYKDGKFELEDHELKFYLRVIKLYTTRKDANQALTELIHLILTNAALALTNHLLIEEGRPKGT
jgi:hypothetical protein